MGMHRRGAWLLLVVAAVAAGIRPASAQALPNFGKVEMDKVWPDYKLYQKLSKDYQELQKRLEDEVQQRKLTFPLLLEEEYARMTALRFKAERTPPEQNDVNKLLGLSNDRDREIATLSAIADDKITEAQKARRQVLLNIQSQCQTQIAEMGRKHLETLKSKDAEMSALLKKQVEAGAKAVADEKHLLAVLQSDVFLYGGEDVTQALVAKLNAMPEPKPEPPKP